VRLVRASELNTHLKQMNLAAAGLAHETRNPLNIIRGLAQMISKQTDAPPEVRGARGRFSMKPTASRRSSTNSSTIPAPREVRRAALALGSVVNEVVRALNYDIDEKHIRLQSWTNNW